jgi:hypothetical protein
MGPEPRMRSLLRCEPAEHTTGTPQPAPRFSTHHATLVLTLTLANELVCGAAWSSAQAATVALEEEVRAMELRLAGGV